MKEITDKHDLKIIVDNTFLSPLFKDRLNWEQIWLSTVGQNSLVDIMTHWQDFCVRRMKRQRRRSVIYKTVGSCLAPFDNYLILRGIKTLSVRLRAYNKDNAMKIANWLKGHEKVKQV